MFGLKIVKIPKLIHFCWIKQLVWINPPELDYFVLKFIKKQIIIYETIHLNNYFLPIKLIQNIIVVINKYLYSLLLLISQQNPYLFGTWLLFIKIYQAFISTYIQVTLIESLSKLLQTINCCYIVALFYWLSGNYL